MTITRTTALTIVAVAALAAMGLVLHNGFVYDDWPAIVRNPHVTDVAQWPTIPSSPYWLGTLWRPLTVMFFALEWSIAHGSPTFFHAVSLLAYIATGYALWQLLQRLAVGPALALGATVMWVVHPVHVEVVAGAVGQAELWVALSLIGSTALYLHARRARPTLPRLAGLLAMVTVGIAAKEQGFMVFPLLCGVEWLLLSGQHERLATRVRLLVPVLALSLLLLVVRASVLGTFAGETPAVALQGLSFGGRAMTFLATLPEYLRLAVWPMHLQADYGPPGLPVGGAFSLRHVVGAALLLLVIWLFMLARRRNPVAAFGLWWMAMTLVPVSNLLTPTGLVMAERVLFLPSIGLVIALAAAAQARLLSPRAEPLSLGAPPLSPRAEPLSLRALPLSPRAQRGGSELATTDAPRDHDQRSRRLHVAVLVLAAGWILVMTVRSATRLSVWRDQEHFFTAIVRDAPRAYRAWKVAGEYWDATGNAVFAERSLTESIALWPHDYEVNERLGQLLRVAGRCDQAVPVLVAGLSIDPDAASSRAKAVECLIVLRQWDRADALAAEGVRRGQPQFAMEQARVARARAAADPR